MLKVKVEARLNLINVCFIPPPPVESAVVLQVEVCWSVSDMLCEEEECITSNGLPPTTALTETRQM